MSTVNEGHRFFDPKFGFSDPIDMSGGQSEQRLGFRVKLTLVAHYKP